ncbi:MAG: hypothetical protein Ct9H90mP16_02390 [Candidatus Poseidoniales archaeon]|nr:MAG: hypothetical protein Ct9H90mP16_02390 [Candidatus Poseidoniales archaeon]
MEDYDLSLIPGDSHSPIVGWAFDGYPIYGMYGYDSDEAQFEPLLHPTPSNGHKKG